MESNLSRQITGLKIYSGILTLAVLILAGLYCCVSRENNHFKEIYAERINVVEADGTLRLVISNKKEQHPGRIDGKDIPKRERDAGLIFFNDEGDECGGLTWGGNKKGADATYSIDQHRNDQVMQLNYNEDEMKDGKRRAYGFKLWDRLDEYPLGALLQTYDSLHNLHDTVAARLAMDKLSSAGAWGINRMFLGKTRDKDVGLIIRDSHGTPRIRLVVDSSNKVVFQTMDEKGNVQPYHP